MMFKQKILSGAVAGALLVMSGSAMASGFALIEQSASGLGNAFAGGAASAEDATTVFFNPAGMVHLEGKQVAVSAHFIQPGAKFSGAGIPGAGNGGDAGGLAVVPNGYFTMQVKPGMSAGIGVNTPFGLQTEYDANWAGKHQAIKSKIETINVNPSVAYRLNNLISVGAGINYQHISGELSNYGGSLLGVSTVTGSDNTWGYNFGVLYDLNDGNSRIGFAYRSEMSYTLKGSVTTSLPFANGPASLDIKLPDSYSFSAFHRWTPQLDLMGDVSVTNWSTFKQVAIKDGSGAVISSTIENWKDTVRVSVGATQHYNAQWLARVGLAYDQAPVSDEYRTARIPDGDRTWLAVGGQYKPDAASAIDFGYAHLFVKNQPINQPSPVPALVGTYKLWVNIFSVQYTRNF